MIIGFVNLLRKFATNYQLIISIFQGKFNTDSDTSKNVYVHFRVYKVEKFQESRLDSKSGYQSTCTSELILTVEKIKDSNKIVGSRKLFY